MHRQGSEGIQRASAVTVNTQTVARDLRWRRPTTRGVRDVRLGEEGHRRCQVGHGTCANRVDNSSVRVNESGPVGKKGISIFLYSFFYEHKSQNKIQKIASDVRKYEFFS
jgi:hypothetical protein